MKLEVSATDVPKLMAEEIAKGERASKQAMTRAANQVKGDWRQQVESAGLGPKLARTIRAKTYPENDDSFNPAALIWTKAPKILDAHIRGATIRSKDGFWLAIPTPAAGRGRGGKRMTPGEWEQRRGIKLRFVYRRNAPSLLVADKARINKRGLAVESRAKTGRNQVTAPIFILVPQVTLKKRLDLARLIDSVNFASDFVAVWK